MTKLGDSDMLQPVVLYFLFLRWEPFVLYLIYVINMKEKLEISWRNEFDGNFWVTFNSVNSLSDFSLFIAFTSKMQQQPLRSTWLWLWFWFSVGGRQQFSIQSDQAFLCLYSCVFWIWNFSHFGEGSMTHFSIPVGSITLWLRVQMLCQKDLVLTPAYLLIISFGRLFTLFQNFHFINHRIIKSLLWRFLWIFIYI